MNRTRKRNMTMVLLLLAVAVVLGAAWVAAVASLHAGGDAGQAAAERATPASRRVAILIFTGVEIIDFTGPYEVFGGAGYEVYTVAASPRPLTTAMGMTVTPRFTFADSPKPDVLVLPGGWIDSVNDSPEARAWVKKTAGAAPLVLSVCNGAFILAEAGLLDGLQATTYAGALDWLQQAAPKTRVVRDKRFVDNGKIITSAGLSSGIDGALHVIERLDGRGVAAMVATNLEYNWDPESKYVRAALADRYLAPAAAFLKALPQHRALAYEGNTERWQERWLVDTDAPPAQLLAGLQGAVTASGAWQRQHGALEGAAAAEGKGIASRWRFADERGRAWRGSARVEPAPGEPHKRLVALRVELAAS
jgi:putative intracellular protease/amidase